MENIENKQTDVLSEKMQEPEISENSSTEDKTEEQEYTNTEGQSLSDPSNLILGKFKNVEDLSKAYVELQKHQGENSKELGDLRKNANSVNNLSETLKRAVEIQGQMTDYLKEYRQKYDSPEYFQDEKFREIYKEAFKVLGQNLDTDKFVNLLESYVTSRIASYDKKQAANAETQMVLDSMTYEKNQKTEFVQPKKRFDEMTQAEIDDMLERLI